MATDAQLQAKLDNAHDFGQHLARHIEAYHLMMEVAALATPSQHRFRLEALQQAGVYAANAGEHTLALMCYANAETFAQTPTERGSILRDRARSLHACGETSQAGAALEEAMALHEDARVELALDKGFLGRITFDDAWGDWWTSRLTGSLRRKRRADMASGLDLMEGADGMLSPRYREDITAEEAYHRANVQLYNKLHLASAMRRFARNKSEREAAQRVVRDCLRLIAEDHGNFEHKLRAYALLRGGWPAESFLMRLRPLLRKVKH